MSQNTHLINKFRKEFRIFSSGLNVGHIHTNKTNNQAQKKLTMMKRQTTSTATAKVYFMMLYRTFL